MDDVFNKLPFTDENKEFTYFRMDDFYAFLKKNNWEMDKIKTGNLLKRLEDIFVSEERMRIKNIHILGWMIFTHSVKRITGT